MILEIKLLDIQHLIECAKKEYLVFCDRTLYWGIFEGAELVGFTGIIFQRHKAIFKNHYIIRAKRGNGYFKKLLDFSLQTTKEKGINIIEANVTEKSINEYIKRGFTVVREYKNGIKKVRKET